MWCKEIHIQILPSFVNQITANQTDPSDQKSVTTWMLNILAKYLDGQKSAG